MKTSLLQPIQNLRVSHYRRKTWQCLGLAALIGSLSLNGRAAFHEWSVNELFSNADGSVQFVEFAASVDFQELLGGHTITCSGPLGINSYTFPSNLVSGTANKTFIVGTANLSTVPGGLRPDYVFTNATPFLFLNMGATNTVTLAGAITLAAVYTNLPMDGSRSLFRTGSGTSFATIATNSPKNYSSQSNRLVPVLISSAAVSGGDMLLSFATATGPNGTTGSNYAVQVKAEVNAANWNTVSNVTGNGATRTVAVPVGALSNQFFRLRVP